MRPTIAQADEQIGFYWRTVDGTPVTLPELVALDDEPARLPPTHLSALDDALIDAAARFGELLGGGRPVSTLTEADDLRELHRTLDRLCHEYATALPAVGMPVDVRAGQIIGTAALIATRARMALGTAGPFPFAGELDVPGDGVFGGHGRLWHVDPDRPALGARWVLVGEDGRNYPLTLSMLLFDSSGVNKDGAVDEHRAALRAAVEHAAGGDSSPEESSRSAGAIEWLLYDWLMAHREDRAGAAITIPANRVADAELIVASAAAQANARAGIDRSLLHPSRTPATT